jgi:hypothetical protein
MGRVVINENEPKVQSAIEELQGMIRERFHKRCLAYPGARIPTASTLM